MNVTPISHPALASGWPPGTRTPRDHARIQSYAESSAFYEGWQGDDRNRAARQLTFNYARTLLRKTVSYMFGGPVGISIPADPTATDRANKAEQQLTAWRDHLGLTMLDAALATDALVQGDAAMKITWDTTAGTPSVVPVHPGSLTVRTAPDNPRTMQAVNHLYQCTPAQLHTQFGVRLDPAIDAQKPIPTLEEWTATTFRVLADGQVVVDMANPCGLIPYVIIANDPAPNQFWGQSDLADLIPVCTELNTRMSVLSQILELSGSPITVLEGVDGTEGIRIGPGAKWELPEGARAYLLDLLQGGAAEVHLRYVEVLFRMLHDLSETPRTAFGDGGRDLSGAALEVEIQPLVQRIQRKRRQWDLALTRRNQLLLNLAARHADLDTTGFGTPVNLWPPILPSDTEAAVRTTVQRVQNGLLSRRTAMHTLGETDPDAELNRMASEPLPKGRLA